MDLQVMCTRDVKANSFGRPFFTTSIGEAVRSFGDEVNRAAQDNILYLHPDDFELYVLGVFNTDDGSFTLSERPQQVAVGATVKISKPSSNQ